MYKPHLFSLNWCHNPWLMLFSWLKMSSKRLTGQIHHRVWLKLKYFSHSQHKNAQLLVRHSSSTYQADIAELINCQWNLCYQHVTNTVMHNCSIKLCSQFMVPVSLFNGLMQFYLCSLTLNFWQMTSLSSMVEVMAYSRSAPSHYPNHIQLPSMWPLNVNLFLLFLYMCVMAVTITWYITML